MIVRQGDEKEENLWDEIVGDNTDVLKGEDGEEASTIES